MNEKSQEYSKEDIRAWGEVLNRSFAGATEVLKFTKQLDNLYELAVEDSSNDYWTDARRWDLAGKGGRVSDAFKKISANRHKTSNLCEMVCTLFTDDDPKLAMIFTKNIGAATAELSDCSRSFLQELYVCLPAKSQTLKGVAHAYLAATDTPVPVERNRQASRRENRTLGIG